MARLDLRHVLRRYAERLAAVLTARLDEVHGILEELDRGRDLVEAAELLRLAHRKIDPCQTDTTPNQAPPAPSSRVRTYKRPA